MELFDELQEDKDAYKKFHEQFLLSRMSLKREEIKNRKQKKFSEKRYVKMHRNGFSSSCTMCFFSSLFSVNAFPHMLQ